MDDRRPSRRGRRHLADQLVIRGYQAIIDAHADGRVTTCISTTDFTDA